MTYLSSKDIGRPVLVRIWGKLLVGRIYMIEGRANPRQQCISVMLNRYPQRGGTAVLREEIIVW